MNLLTVLWGQLQDQKGSDISLVLGKQLFTSTFSLPSLLSFLLFFSSSSSSSALSSLHFPSWTTSFALFFIYTLSFIATYPPFLSSPVPSIVLECLLFPLLLHLHLLQTSHNIHILYAHISGVMCLSALVEVTVYLTQPSFSDGGWLSMARLVFSLLCLKALWTLWSAASGPGRLTEGQTATNTPERH